MQKNSFQQFDLSEPMCKALTLMGFENPTEVQNCAIEPALEGHDLLVQAPTGTGKTAAFGIPLIENITTVKTLQALILCPTRELATQTAKVLKQLAQCKKSIQVVAVYGGESIARQFSALRSNPQIVVATPGRLLDHLKRKSIRLNTVQTLVMDEADRMLDMGFRDDLKTIVSKTSPQRQTLLFSATMSKEITGIAKAYQSDPQTIVLSKNNSQDQSQIQQFFAETTEKGKFTLLKNLLNQEDYRLSLVFVNTKAKAADLALKLKECNIKADSMHGDMRQFERDKIMRMYRNKKIDVLVATDVAARGIDVQEIDAVINYDLPNEQENYVHRIGRTGRAQQKGTAYTFICPNERHKIKSIARNTKMKLEPMPKTNSVQKHQAAPKRKAKTQGQGNTKTRRPAQKRTA